MPSTILTIHLCLICGHHMSQYDGWEKATPPVCRVCSQREAVIHPNWFRPTIVANLDAMDVAA